VFTIEQRQRAPSHRLRAMSTTAVNATITALTMITVGAFGLVAPVTTPSGWFMLAAVATVPPLIFMHYCKRPVQTMSESIQEAIQ
jgi:hypothetical protein